MDELKQQQLKYADAINQHRLERLAAPRKPVGYRKVRLYKPNGAKEMERRLRRLAEAGD